MTDEHQAAGHRVQVEVRSNDDPTFDLRPAHQSVFHDGARPSFIELPVIRRR